MADRNTESDERLTRRAHPKNTKRWCRGTVGREHVTQLVIPTNAIRQFCILDSDAVTGADPSTFTWEVGCVHIEQCIDCGKHVRPFLNRGECPTRQPSDESDCPHGHEAPSNCGLCAGIDG